MTEAEKERAAIVAWLRGQEVLCDTEKASHPSYSAEWASCREQAETYAIAADAIERGDHRDADQ